MIIACYNDGELIFTDAKSTDDTVFTVSDSLEYDEVKIFAWSSFAELYPVTQAENVK